MDSILPEIEVLLENLDRSMAHVMPALQALPEQEKLQQSVALSLALSLRLCTFGLGPAAQIHPEQIQSTAMAILDTLRDLEQDLWRNLNSSKN